MAKRPAARVAVVHCGGGSVPSSSVACDTSFGSCSELLQQHPDGVQACRFGCLGEGSCVAACNVGAIAINKQNVAEVDREKCIGCGLCAKACPKRLIEIVPVVNAIYVRCANQDRITTQACKVCAHGCVACGMCERVCPTGAIRVINDHAVIDQKFCIACGKCVVMCPRGVIRDTNGIF